MTFKCLACGHIFEEGEQARWEEHHPYGMGYAAEEFSGCPICKGDYEQTVKCRICDGEFLEDELNGGCVCNDCIDDYKKDFETCYKIADEEKEEIEINSLLVSFFDTTEIETILYQHIKNSGIDIDCSNFINEDKDWFAEKLAEEVSK